MLDRMIDALENARAGTVLRAVVSSVADDGSITVDAGQSMGTFVCDRLVTGRDSVSLAPHDAVLCFYPSTESNRGVVIGRVGPSHLVPTVEDPAAPDELVLQATDRIVLRVGDGSIEIRSDGKVLIKGRDLVSHATRVNRIKGGAISIN
jgi:hypothetical protein